MTTALSTAKRYYPQSRVERLIATGRMILSGFFLLAIWLDPSEPSRYAGLTYAILVGYLAYAIFIGVVMWCRDFTRGRLQVPSHAVDLLVFAVIMFLTAGPNSPFFVYYIFLLVCATLRWQWRGTLWTAVAALVIVTALAWYPSNLLHDHNFELNRFIIRLVYLAVVATLLGYLGLHEQSMRNVLSKLTEWPRTHPKGLHSMSREILEHAATILGVPRIVLAWEEDEEPWLHLASWSQEGCQFLRENPAIFGTLVAEQLVGTSFFCRNAGERNAMIVHNTADGLQDWTGAPLHPLLQENFDIEAVLVSRVKGERMEGYLLALDKPLMTSDDLVLGGIVAHEIAARLDHFLLLKQLERAAVSDERVRLARDLHDGLLQSLTVAALQLETAQRLVEKEPQRARQRIQEIQRLLAVEQRDLRSHINDLRPYLPCRAPEEFGLALRLEELAERVRRQWDVAVEITTLPPAPRITRGMAREVYFVVQEALVNAARHAEASTLRAHLAFNMEMGRITVTDNGRGFAFRGRYDLDALSEMKRGPVTLKERVSALRGTLSIDSTEAGARLEITLPITMHGGSNID